MLTKLVVLLVVSLVTPTSATPAGCTVTESLGCFADSNSQRILPHAAVFETHGPSSLTVEACAEACCHDGYTGAYSGVEYQYQCFCSKAFDPTTAKKLDDSACANACPGNSSEHCGGSDAIVVTKFACAQPQSCKLPPGPPPPPPPPTIFGCRSDVALKLPFCDASLSFDARIDDLLGRLSLDEKISLLSPTHNPYCAIHTPAIDRLGFPAYKWLTETNTDVGGLGCKADQTCPTTFVGPEGVAASFNRSAWWMKGDVVSTDMRAFLPDGITGSAQRESNPSGPRARSPLIGGHGLACSGLGPTSTS